MLEKQTKWQKVKLLIKSLGLSDDYSYSKRSTAESVADKLRQDRKYSTLVVSIEKDGIIEHLVCIKDDGLARRLDRDREIAARLEEALKTKPEN